MTGKKMLRRMLSFGKSALEIHNEEILQSSGISSIELPSLFAIWRHGDHTRIGTDTELPNAYTAVLVAVTKVQPVQPEQPAIWKFQLVQHPIEAIYHGTCEPSADHWLENSSPAIIIRRDSSFLEESGKLYVTTLTHSGLMILCHQTETRIPVFKITNKCLILPSRFTTIDSPGNSSWRFSLYSGLTIRAPTYTSRIELQGESAQQFLERGAGAGGGGGGGGRGAGRAMSPQGAGHARTLVQHPVQQPQRQQARRQQMVQALPQHIVNAYIDDIIRKREDCPIEMTPLTRENAALTPCGHAVQQSAGARWILDAHSCPVCRVQCSPDQLQTWRA
jgi:hypothetical protein